MFCSRYYWLWLWIRKLQCLPADGHGRGDWFRIQDLEILKLLVRLAGNERAHTSVGDSNVSKGKQNLVVQPTFHSSRSNAEMLPPEAAGGIQGPQDDAVINSILFIRALLPASQSPKYFVLFLFQKKYRALKSWRANSFFFKGTIIIWNGKAEDFCHAKGTSFSFRKASFVLIFDM